MKIDKGDIPIFLFWLVCSPMLIGFFLIWCIALFPSPRAYWEWVIFLKFIE